MAQLTDLAAVGDGGPSAGAASAVRDGRTRWEAVRHCSVRTRLVTDSGGCWCVKGVHAAKAAHQEPVSTSRPIYRDDMPAAVGHDCHDHEDNLILDLAAEVGALLIVSNDTNLLSMSPWRGTPVIDPAVFVGKVDAMRRHARRTRR